MREHLAVNLAFEVERDVGDGAAVLVDAPRHAVATVGAKGTVLAFGQRLAGQGAQGQSRLRGKHFVVGVDQDIAHIQHWNAAACVTSMNGAIVANSDL